MTTTLTSLPSASDVEKRKPLIKSGLRVAVIGKAGAGKTTASNWIGARYGHERLHFAAALKEHAAALWGEDVVHHNRGYLQQFGVAIRNIDPDTWVRILVSRINNYDESVPLVVDDCRFPNEVDALVENEFRFIRIEADEAVREDRLMRIGKLESHEQLHHESETAIDDYKAEITIRNDMGDWEAFQRLVFSAMGTLNGHD
jgi:dephospho-CoA kinase